MKREHPDEPIHLLAHSAGTAIVAYAMEMLGEDEPITSAVFAGSGLSPHYDLTACLKRCKAGILSLESWFDCFFLGVGTTLLGTAIGDSDPLPVWSASASSWCLLRHLAKTAPASMLRRQGWVGGAPRLASPSFVRETLVPWIRHAESAVQDVDGNGLRAKSSPPPADHPPDAVGQIGDAVGGQSAVVRSFGVDRRQSVLRCRSADTGPWSDTSGRPGNESEVPPLEFAFESLPRGGPDLSSAAIGANAQEHVPVILADQVLLGNCS